jgi:hypothetical protein
VPQSQTPETQRSRKIKGNKCSAQALRELDGRRFKLENPTLALDVVNGRRLALTIPAGETIQVVSSPVGQNGGLVEAVWEGRRVAMFAFDVSMRGIEIAERAAKA